MAKPMMNASAYQRISLDPIVRMAGSTVQVISAKIIPMIIFSARKGNSKI
jgi:hypothetical protein